jgi:hypothetical protein
MGDFKKLFLRKKLEKIVVIPATLYFPSAIVAQLNEICDQSGFTPGQLVVRALKGARSRRISAGRRTPFSAWRVSQLSIFYRVSRGAFTTPLLSSNKKSTRRPNGLSVFEEPDEADPADWWKTLS